MILGRFVSAQVRPRTSDLERPTDFLQSMDVKRNWKYEA